MRVLLVSPNVERLPDPVFPIGLAHIAAALKDNDIPYQILDLCFVEDYERAIDSSIASFQPDVVGLSLRNVDNVSYPNYTSYLPFYRQVVERIRKRSRAFVVLGGSGFSLLPEPILEYLDADLGIVGEGEISFVRFIEDLEKGKTAGKKLKQSIIRHGVIENLNSQPIPDRSGFDHEAYLAQGGMGNLQSKRGCPFRCVYCVYPIVEGKKVRLRNPQLVCDEIESMLEHGTDNLFFVDSVFNYPVDHAVSICEEILRRRLAIKWSCYANPRFVTRELVAMMKPAGCTSLEFGSDAACPKMLNNFRKEFTVKDLKGASSICQQADMPFCHSLLLGGPGETMETVCETLDNMLDMSPTAVICMLGIRVFPKTELSRIGAKEGIIDPETDFLESVFYLSPQVRDEIVPFMEKFSKKNPTWIFPGMNINMNAKLQRKLRRFGFRGPLWEQIQKGRLFLARWQGNFFTE